MGQFKASEIENWSAGLGLMPVGLFPNKQHKTQFILLNGSNGNFCVDINPKKDVERARDYAWSSNSGHFVDLVNNHIHLYRWDMLGQAGREVIPLKYVSENLDKFYKYLIDTQPKNDNSIVNFSIKTFRKLKYSLRRDVNSGEALKAFLVLLATVTDDSTISKLNKTKWGLTAKDLQYAELVPKLDWQALQEELLMGIKYYNLIPDFSLVIRHTSGQLFQEAHYETMFANSSQLSFEGMLVEAERPTIRTSVGVHYTPSSIVRTIVEEAFYFYDVFNKKQITIFDPACGSGEFLRESLRQLSAKRFKGKLKIIGWDVSAVAIDMARFVVSYELRDWQPEKVTVQLSVQDSLSGESKWPQGVDVVLMNPPFVSWENMTPGQRDTVSQVLGDAMEKRPDYSTAFVLSASRCLQPNGILAAIIPASFLSGNSNRKVRDDLKDRMTPLLIGRLGSQILFTDALVDSSIFIAKNGSNKDIFPTSMWADVQPNSASSALRSLRKLRLNNDDKTIIDAANYSIYQDKSLFENSNWIPRSYNSFKVNERLKNFTRVKDTFNIQQGIRTGHNPAFIVPKDYWLSLTAKERKYFRPCIINKSLIGGQINDNFYVFYPYGPELKSISSEDELMTFLPKYYEEILLPNKDILITRARIGESDWWELSEYRAWQVKKQPKLVSAYFGRSGSFAFDKTGDYAIVQGFGWTPKSSKPLRSEIHFAYLAILNSNIIDTLLDAVAGQVSGGQYELSKRYLENMPFPNLATVSDEQIKILAQYGKELDKGRNVSYDNLDEIVRSLYKI